MAEKIEDAIKTTFAIAESKNTDLKERVRWYQVLGYLGQTLDSILQNVDQSEAEKQLAELKEIVVSLQTRTTRNPQASPTAQS